jgi:hypothetical protein
MPPDGAVILADVRAPTPSIVCEGCRRYGRYDVTFADRALVPFGGRRNAVDHATFVLPVAERDAIKRPKRTHLLVKVQRGRTAYLHNHGSSI